ncbi:MAG TPA: hypothetical protein VIC60_01695 [Thermomicrobiales bacterium]|jgi:hypothetical protein
MTASILTHYNSREARSHFADLMREVVRDGRPVVIAPRDETASVVVERELLLRLLEPYAPHVEIIPEDGTDGFTIWVEELRATARGASLAAAREAMARDAFSEVHHFLSLWPRFKHTDRRGDFPYVFRLALAETVEEMRDLIFSRFDALATSE